MKNKVKITDLPKDVTLSKDEMENVRGGFLIGGSDALKWGGIDSPIMKMERASGTGDEEE